MNDERGLDAFRCVRCGQWKPDSQFIHVNEARAAFCMPCQAKVDLDLDKVKMRDDNAPTWIDRLRNKARSRPLPRADSLPLSTERERINDWPAGGRPSERSSTKSWSSETKQCTHRGDEVKGVNRPDSTAGLLLGSSYRGGLKLPRGGITVILTPEALADVQYLTGKGNAWATADGLEFPMAGKPPSDIVFWPWPDMGVPTDKPGSGDVVTIVKRLRALHLAHLSGRTIEVACFGGHGRTGILLAILAALYKGWDSREAVRLLRDAYCQKAVETPRQAEWVRKAIDAVRFMMASSDEKAVAVDLNIPKEEYVEPSRIAEMVDDAIASGEPIEESSLPTDREPTDAELDRAFRSAQKFKCTICLVNPVNTQSPLDICRQCSDHLGEWGRRKLLAHREGRMLQ